MPVVLLERIPLPSLKTYTSISIVLLGFAVYYAHQVVTGGFLEDGADEYDGLTETQQVGGSPRNLSEHGEEIGESLEPEAELPNLNLPQEGYLFQMAHVLIQETVCIWVLINMAYCTLILFGKVIQKAVFGQLRVSEEQHLKDKFWNFVFYKFIFIFGVMNVQNMDEVVLWCAWFSVLGFLHLLAQLSKDRFEYLSFSPTTPTTTHAKVLLLLSGILFSCICLLGVCVILGYLYAGLNTFAFMAAECVLLIIKALYVIVRYAIHLWDLNQDGIWENRAIYVYYSELIFELSALSVDFAHHLHMLLWGNIFLSMASLVICMQLRYLFHEFQRRIKRHKNYRRVVNSMEAKFPMANKDELENNADDCAICWEKMDSARKLPCGHFFHNACLRSWLEQDTSCPTCRTSLSDPQSRRPSVDIPVHNGGGDAPPTPTAEPAVNQTTNHFFHFDGSRYVSWLPSFSLEVTHTQILNNLGAQQQMLQQTSQLDNMARQVREVFPSLALNTLLDDLRVTHSVELTIENIIEGRITQPPALPNHSTPSSQPPSAISTTAHITTFSPPTDIPLGHGIHSLGGSTIDSWSSGGSISTSAESLEGLPTMQQAAMDIAGSTSHSHLNFIKDDNVPDRTQIEDSDSSSRLAAPVVTGYRFSKSPTERHVMLSSRKEHMLEQARRRFAVNAPTQDEHPHTSQGSDSDLGLQGAPQHVQPDPQPRRRIVLPFMSSFHHNAHHNH